jgi:hypothetical protein
MFKRKEMPTPDASQFIQRQKFHAIQKRAVTGGLKLITHLYSPVPRTSALIDFLPSLTNNNTLSRTFTPINLKTGIQLKSRVVPSQFMQS